MYDYLVVGAGLFGAVWANMATNSGKSCLVLEKQDHVGGLLWCEEKDGIVIHTQGAHIFHTSNEKVMSYLSQYANFLPYVHSPIANYNGTVYNLPFNMNTFVRIFGIVTPSIVEQKLEGFRREFPNPTNFEEKAISLVGHYIYERIIKGYTEKQWGRSCAELPASIIERLPVRFTYNNNYFDDIYQGIPKGGYNAMITALLRGSDVFCGKDFLQNRDTFKDVAKTIVYTGAIDAYFDYCFGELEYRSLEFETERLEEPNYQGCAVMNFTDSDSPFTRIIEHKHFAPYVDCGCTYITREYPVKWERGKTPYYPVNDEKNNALYQRYKELAEQDQNVIFGGRLAEYRYYDMDDTVYSAMQKFEEHNGR